MSQKENTFIGVFDNQEEVLNKVTELKNQGHDESHMYIVGRDNNSFSTVHNQTDVHVDATNEKKNQGFLGKVMSALSGDAYLSAFKGMGLERYEAKEYYEQVQNGKLILYVDKEYSETYHQYNTDRSNSSGIEENAPIETGATFAKSSTSGVVDDTNKTPSPDAYKEESISEKSGGRYHSLAEADSDFGKSISADGSSMDPALGNASSQTFNSSGTSGTSAERTVDFNDTAASKTESADYKSASGTRSAEDFASGTNDGASGSTELTDEERLRLHEERLSIDKERVQTGEVNVGKHVVEENQSIEVPVEREEVYVERRSVNEDADATEAFEENDTIHVPISEERVNVSKKDVVAEEIVVGKQKVQDTEQVTETVRKEVADIDEDTNNNKRN